ncbi:MAG: tetraacyldisaccharide 4'-kinase [Nitrospirae bacterium]|nr:MAG: tetraacyldisaccharide 4'-kinase [Nitrospirota bacterium]
MLVAVGTNRYEVGKWVLDRYPVDAFLLDDGFQHVALARDIDLVLVDTSDPGRWRRLLPVGTLREPLTALSRATAIVLTRATPSLPYEALLDELFQAAACRLPVIVTEFYPSQLLHVSTGAFAPLSRGEQRTSMLVSGIGNPLSFRTVVSQIGTLIRGELIFPDHHAYTKQDLLMIRRQLQSCQADMVLTTEKDAVKLRRYVDETDPIWAVRIETRILKGQEELETLFNQLDRLIWTR